MSAIYTQEDSTKKQKQRMEGRLKYLLVFMNFFLLFAPDSAMQKLYITSWDNPSFATNVMTVAT